MRGVNRAQRAILTLILAVDALLCLFPPSLNYANRYVGHRWLLDGFNSDAVRVSFGQLSAEVMVVAIIGAPACVLAAGIPDERVQGWFRRASLNIARRGRFRLWVVGTVVWTLVWVVWMGFSIAYLPGDCHLKDFTFYCHTTRRVGNAIGGGVHTASLLPAFVGLVLPPALALIFGRVAPHVGKWIARDFLFERSATTPAGPVPQLPARSKLSFSALATIILISAVLLGGTVGVLSIAH